METRRTLYAKVLDSMIHAFIAIMFFTPLIFFGSLWSNHISIVSFLISSVFTYAISLKIMRWYYRKFPIKLGLLDEKIVINSFFEERIVEIDKLEGISKIGEGDISNLTGSITYIIKFDNTSILLNSSRFMQFNSFITELENRHFDTTNESD